MKELTSLIHVESELIFEADSVNAYFFVCDEAYKRISENKELLYINLYADYSPATGKVKCFYIPTYCDDTVGEEKDFPVNEEEKASIIAMIEAYCLDECGCDVKTVIDDANSGEEEGGKPTMDEKEGIDYITIPVYSEEPDEDGNYEIIGYRKEYVD